VLNGGLIYLPRFSALKTRGHPSPILAAHASLIQHLIDLLALPEFGLSTVFVVSFISATLPWVQSQLCWGWSNPELFWAAIAVATVGNTLGGALDWWIGYGAHSSGAVPAFQPPRPSRSLAGKLGPKVCLPAWLPVVRRPACRGGLAEIVLAFALASWPLAILRYLTTTAGAVWAFPSFSPVQRSCCR
jgi:membrane protein YqaA with SNARE-associated domain